MNRTRKQPRPNPTPQARRLRHRRDRPRAHPRRGRDPVAWDRLFHRYRHRMAGVARRTLARYGARWAPDEVEEVVQEVWCRLVQHWGPRRLGLAGAGEGRTFTYLARATRNVVIDWLRAAGARKRGGGRERVAWVATPDHLLDCGPDPEELLLARELRELFRARCHRLLSGRRRRDARVLELAILDGWSSREISRHLGGRLSPGAVASLVWRTRRSLGREGVDAVDGWSGQP